MPPVLLLALGLGAPSFAGTVPRGIDPSLALSQLVVTRWSTDEGLPTNVLLSVRQSATRDLWIAGFGGLARFDGIEFETFNRRTGSDVAISSFYDVADAGERLWVATASKGLWKIENDVLSPLSPERMEGSVRALMIDRAGALWVGMAETGAFRLEGDELVALDDPSLSGSTVRAIVEDAEGVLWFGKAAVWCASRPGRPPALVPRAGGFAVWPRLVAVGSGSVRRMVLPVSSRERSPPIPSSRESRSSR